MQVSLSRACARVRACNLQSKVIDTRKEAWNRLIPVVMEYGCRYDGVESVESPFNTLPKETVLRADALQSELH